MSKERIIFMGSAEISREYLISLVQNNFNVIAVFTQPPRKKGRGMKIQESSIHSFAKEKNIPIYDPINFKLVNSINIFKKFKPDIAVVMGYGLLLPKEIINIPRLGCINVHVSLLPRWRGAAPIEHAILNGDKHTGITIFQIEERLDSGPIITSQQVKIEKEFSKEDIIKKLNNLGPSLLVKTLPKLFKKQLSTKNQDDSMATYANKITSQLRKINFNDDIINVYNHIRAFAPKPSAWFVYNGDRINIIKCSMEICKSSASIVINEKFHIGCNNGKIIPEIIQREGKKPLKIKEFLKGYKIIINQKVNA